MLNNANVLIEDDPKKASQVLMKLSDLLRYQLYDSSRDNVLLTSEIHFLEDFLNLEKVRRDNFNFLISKEGELSGEQVPPLLFISFINCFYGRFWVYAFEIKLSRAYIEKQIYIG